MVEERGEGLVEPRQVVAVEHDTLLVDLGVAGHDRQREHTHILAVRVGETCRVQLVTIDDIRAAADRIRGAVSGPR